jgi:predicted DNA-binding protein
MGAVLFFMTLTLYFFFRENTFFICKKNTIHYKNDIPDSMTTESKTVSIKLPSGLVARSEALKEKTGISEAAILRQAITAGIGKVEEAIDLLHEDLIPADQAVS